MQLNPTFAIADITFFGSRGSGKSADADEGDRQLLDRIGRRVQILRCCAPLSPQSGWLTVRVTKNRQVKRLPVPDELADWITEHVRRDARLTRAPLFALPYRGRGRWPAGPLTNTSMRRVWKAACAATVEIRLYESTKHGRVTDLLRQGASERVLQALLGHRGARSTRRYARLADEAPGRDSPRCGFNVDPLRKRPRGAEELRSRTWPSRRSSPT